VETGLDNNRMIRILSGLMPGEKVLLNPPLSPSTVEEEAEGEPGQEPGPTLSPIPGMTTGAETAASAPSFRVAGGEERPAQPGGSRGRRPRADSPP